MEKKDYPACRLIFYILLLVGIVLAIIYSIYKPYYKVTLNGNFIGYYIDYEDYQQHYNKIQKEVYNDELKIIRYYETKPNFEKVLVKAKHVKSFNNYSLIEAQFTEEYVIYNIKVNNEIKFYTKTYEKANAIVEEIKSQVKDSTEIIIEEIKTKDKTLINDEQFIDDIKNQIIKENYKISFRGGGPRVNRENSKYIWPTVSKAISSSFGKRWGRQHSGIDIPVPLNSKIFAVDDGIVVSSCWNGGYGYQVKIRHSNNVVTTYSHCNKLLVNTGQSILQGDVIAYSGNTGNSTGPHLHFEYVVNGVFKNPLNYI